MLHQWVIRSRAVLATALELEVAQAPALVLSGVWSHPLECQFSDPVG